MEPLTSTNRNTKGGRPKKPIEKLKAYPVKTYFDYANYRKLVNRSKRTGMSLSKLVGELAINGYVKEPLSKEVISYLRSLSGMAINLNQLARLAHMKGYLSDEKELKELVGEIDDLLIQISDI